MNRMILRTVAVVAAVLVLLVACEDPNGPSDDGEAVYNVTYDGKEADSGSPPTDNTDYAEGDTVIVLGNTGDLAKADAQFSGWNTTADGDGTTYQPDDTFQMGTSDVTLYAIWESSAEDDSSGDDSSGDDSSGDDSSGDDSSGDDGSSDEGLSGDGEGDAEADVTVGDQEPEEPTDGEADVEVN